MQVTAALVIRVPLVARHAANMCLDPETLLHLLHGRYQARVVRPKETAKEQPAKTCIYVGVLHDAPLLHLNAPQKPATFRIVQELIGGFAYLSGRAREATGAVVVPEYSGEF